jgi:sulfur dioxygenase
MSTVNQSGAYHKVSKSFGIDGVITEESLPFLKENYKSILYLCPDTPDDSGFSGGGFERISAEFGSENARHVPLTLNQQAFNADSPYLFIHALSAYSRFEAALDSLQKPTLIACKSARRASAVLATYLGVKSGLSSEEVQQSSTESGFSYLGSEPLLRWSSLVLSQKRQSASSRLIFRQLFEKESSTYTYLLGDSLTNEAVLIDPVIETVERDAQFVRELGLQLKYCLNTHMHADHITGSGLLKAHFPTSKSIIAEAAEADADVKIRDGDRIEFGSRYLTVLATPGHTNGCVSYLLDDGSLVFTGDALLIRGCGRTDFQQGSSADLYESVHNKLFILPPSTIVYPAHNYAGITSTSIKEETEFNPRLKLGNSLEKFQEIMAGLNLPNPAKIDVALPANRKDGVL